MVRRVPAMLAIAGSIVALAACSGGSEPPVPTQVRPTATVAAAAPTATATPAPTATATTQPAATPTTAPVRSPTVAPTAAPTVPRGATATAASGPSKLALGEQVYQKTAGGVGCAACHGADGKGLSGPNVRGKTSAEIGGQFLGNPSMQFIKLTQEELEAVGEYLAYLATQP